jgi:Myb-like DNA-binding domain
VKYPIGAARILSDSCETSMTGTSEHDTNVSKANSKECTSSVTLAGRQSQNSKNVKATKAFGADKKKSSVLATHHHPMHPGPYKYPMHPYPHLMPHPHHAYPPHMAQHQGAKNGSHGHGSSYTKGLAPATHHQPYPPPMPGAYKYPPPPYMGHPMYGYGFPSYSSGHSVAMMNKSGSVPKRMTLGAPINSKPLPSTAKKLQLKKNSGETLTNQSHIPSLSNQTQTSRRSQSLSTSSQNITPNSRQTSNFCSSGKFGSGSKFPKWTKEEDDKLRHVVDVFGTKNWKLVASKLEGRDQSQCQHRWQKVLKKTKI